MMKYALLANPGHNRVYFEESKKLAAAELELALGVLSVPCGGIAPQNLCGVYYLTFEAEAPLSEEDIAVLSRLSFVYAIFGMTEVEGDPALLPVQMADYAYIGSDIGTILKYTGKTTFHPDDDECGAAFCGNPRFPGQTPAGSRGGQGHHAL